MKILVTGSAGFIGKKLVRALRRNRHQVIEFSHSKENDVTDFKQINSALKGVDVVYHLAAVLDETKKSEMRKVNVRGTENALEAAAKNNVQQFIYLSSIGVYGNFKGKADESFPVNPETEYEKTKADAEKLVWDYQEMLPVTILRSALVMGANKYWEDIVNVIEKDLPMVGDGKNKWQTVYIEDLVSALVFVLGKEETFGEIYNIAEEDEPTLKELYFEIKRNLKMKLEFKSVSSFTGMSMSYFNLILGKNKILIPAHVKRLLKNRNYSISKIKKLGWKPRYNMTGSVVHTVNELKGH
ncbi:MAG: NAD(P)-dependent oxidoreductase [Candidatus Diapherotrites archaeon]